MIESTLAISPEDVARHYDQLDRFYREVWGEHVHHGVWRTGRETPEEAVLTLCSIVAEKTRLHPGDKVCDVGCGYGATSRWLAKEHGADVTGFTISPAQHRKAEELTEGDNPRFRCQDWLTNDLPPATFDAAIAIESTEHMQDKQRVFDEIARVLKPGGRAVICAWLAGDHIKPWEHRWLMEPVCREGRLPAMGTEGEYAEWIQKAGLKLVGAEDLSMQVVRTWPICAWRFLKGIFSRPGYLRFLLEPANDNRIFAFTVLRIWLAYRTGAMRYVVFSASR